MIEWRWTYVEVYLCTCSIVGDHWHCKGYSAGCNRYPCLIPQQTVVARYRPSKSDYAWFLQQSPQRWDNSALIMLSSVDMRFFYLVSLALLLFSLWCVLWNSRCWAHLANVGVVWSYAVHETLPCTFLGVLQRLILTPMAWRIPESSYDVLGVKVVD